MTYGEIYNEFLKITGINTDIISDYRPCCEMFGVPNIGNAIIIWLEDGNKLIYIHS